MGGLNQRSEASTPAMNGLLEVDGLRCSWRNLSFLYEYGLCGMRWELSVIVRSLSMGCVMIEKREKRESSLEELQAE